MPTRKRLTPAERLEVLNKYNKHCAYCGCKLTIETMKVDHIESAYLHEYFKRDTDLNAVENLNPSCGLCNFYKSSDSIEDFRKRMTTLHLRIKKPYIVRLGELYGIVQLKKFDGLFYFEKFQKENDKRE